MIGVADVERSVAFYGLLGFAVGNRQPREGTMHWAWLYGPKVEDWRRGPNLMLTRRERPTVGLVLYLYARDLESLRAELVRAGQSPGPIEYPEYLPEGEFSLVDPDGCSVMVAQSGQETP